MLDPNDPAYLQLFADGPWQLRKRIVRNKDFLVFDHMINRNPVILDIGANKGQSIASFLGVFPEATIHAFECHPALHPVLMNMKQTCAEECRNVTIHVFALGAEDGFLKFVTPIVDGKVYYEETTCKPEVEFEKHKNRLLGYGKEFSVHEFSVKVCKGDDLHIDPNIIKIDTEGSEPDVIRGLFNSIKKTLPVIYAETSCYREVTDLLASIGYKPFVPDEEKRIVPLSRGRGDVLYLHPSSYALFREGSVLTP
jgi:FkbM family methyltransferase